MHIRVISIFPQLIESFYRESILSRAIERGLVKIEAINLRNYTNDRHNVVDDYPYGGGPGMVMKAEPLAKAITALQLPNQPRIYLTPQGESFSQKTAEELSLLPGMLLVCGRYRGIDERIREHYIDREISLGDFVLNGGEIAALALIEAVVRLIPGVLGNEDSVEAESFSCGLLDSPQYTRPEEFEGWQVPEILLSGNHAKITAWRLEQAILRTQKRRPDIVQVEFKIVEGEKERVQPFEGVVIARRHESIRETFIVRRIASGVGVERTFPLHSPRIVDIKITRRGRVRRSKLYFLRGKSGKAARIREGLQYSGRSEDAPVPKNDSNPEA